MTDTFSKEMRSEIMRKVKSKDTKPEIVLRKLLHQKGFRFTLHQKKYPGTPDIVLPRYKTIMNVHGCFWHGHFNCKHAILPTTNIDYWETKINKNKHRDECNNCKLLEMGWEVITIYECELRAKNIDITLDKIINILNKIKLTELDSPSFNGS